MSILCLFCECYAHLLLVLDDSEFYGESAVIQSSSSKYNSNNNFTLSEVVGMLRYLKRILLSLLVDDDPNTLPLKYYRSSDTLLRLF